MKIEIYVQYMYSLCKDHQLSDCYLNFESILLLHFTIRKICYLFNRKLCLTKNDYFIQPISALATITDVLFTILPHISNNHTILTNFSCTPCNSIITIFYSATIVCFSTVNKGKYTEVSLNCLAI